MFHFSFSTVFMAFLASGIIATLIAIAFLHKNIMTYAGYKFLAFFVGLAIFRLVLPFEFPFTSTVILPALLSRVISLFLYPCIPFWGAQISFWNLFEIIWILGIIIHFHNYLRNCRLTKNYIQKYGQDTTNNPKYQTTLDSICAKHHKPNRFHVIELEQLDTPVLWGLKRPYILLPADLSISPDKLYYVLYHEALHCFRHDLLVKNIIHILSIIYWWNPVCILLRKQSHTILEMCIDGTISQNDPNIVEKYAECLFYMRKAAEKKIYSADAHLKKDACPLIQPLNGDFKRRTLMLLIQPSRLQKIFTNITLALLILSVFIASHLFILEAAYLPPEVKNEVIPYTAENTYFIRTADYSYEFYIYGEYMETVTNLEYYPQGIKIYNKEGDLINEN